MLRINKKACNLIITISVALIILFCLFYSIPSQVSRVDQAKKEEKLVNILTSKEIRQDFVAQSDYLSTISVNMSTYMKKNTSKILFTLEDDNNAVVAETVINGDTIKDNLAYPINFEAQKNSKGKVYTIIFKPIEVKENDEIVFWTSKDDEYTLGKLTIDKTGVSKDLTFSTTYKKGKYLNIKDSFSRIPINPIIFLAICGLLFISLVIFVFESLNRYND